MKSFVSALAAIVFALAPSLDANAAARHPASKAKVVKAKAAKSKATPAKAAPKARKALAVAAAVAAVSAIDYAGEPINFGEWQAVSSFVDEMVAKHGFDRGELEAQMRQVRFVESAVQLVKPAPPGKPKNWQAYSSRFIEPIRINAGLRFWNENEAALARAVLFGASG
jgi:membrane-bound lytic murein transglycosylase B